MNDLFSALGKPPAQQENPNVRAFHSVGQARDWLERDGWQPRHSGGYWKGTNGYATIVAAAAQTKDAARHAVVVNIGTIPD